MRRKWSAEEEDRLLEFIKSPKNKTMIEIAEEMGRSRGSVRSKLTKLRKADNELGFVRRYSEEMEDYLDSFSNDPDTECIKSVAKHFGKSYNSVAGKLVRMRKDSEYTGHLKRRWSKREDNALKHSHGIVPNKELAELLGRSENSITYRARVLGLTKNVVDFSGVGNEIKLLASKGYTRKQIAEKTDINYTAIQNYIYRNKIKCTNASREKTKEQKEMHQEFLSHAFRRY